MMANQSKEKKLLNFYSCCEKLILDFELFINCWYNDKNKIS